MRRSSIDTVGGIALILAVAACTVTAADLNDRPAARGDTDSAQPTQPTAGPGGSDYPHADWRVTAGGEGVYAWYVFEPIDPEPASAPLVIVMHGYGELSGYDTHDGLLRHTVRKGNIVIYPRWQTGLLFPCNGPLDVEPCVDSARIAIVDALASLAADGHVHPQLDRTSYFGFSFGAILTANLTNRHAALGLPVPRAIFLDDPHDGGTAGAGEPALDASLDGIPATTKVECHAGAEGVIADETYRLSGCNALFPRLAHIPDANKDLVMVRTDTHGTPTLSSKHGVSVALPETAASNTADAYDWGFVWKVFDALRSCAYDRIDCEYALGDTAEHRSLGA
jgi:hypothetical protein